MDFLLFGDSIFESALGTSVGHKIKRAEQIPEVWDSYHSGSNKKVMAITGDTRLLPALLVAGHISGPPLLVTHSITLMPYTSCNLCRSVTAPGWLMVVCITFAYKLVVDEVYYEVHETSKVPPCGQEGMFGIPHAMMQNKLTIQPVLCQ